MQNLHTISCTGVKQKIDNHQIHLINDKIEQVSKKDVFFICEILTNSIS